MGFLTQTMFRPRAATLETGPLTAERITEWIAGQPTSTGVKVNETTAMKYSVVNSCVRLLADTLAQVPHLVYRREERDGWVYKRRARKTPEWKVVHTRPNPEMAPFTYYQMAQAHLVKWGNFYAEPEYTRGGDVLAYWPLPPWKTEPERIGGTKVLQVDVGEGKPRTLYPGKYLHVPGLGFDGLKGKSAISWGREAIGLGLAQQESAGRYFGNSMRPEGFLKNEHALIDKAYDRLKREFQNEHGGLERSHRIKLLEEGLQWEQTGISPGDSQVVEQREFQVVDVCRYFRVPPHKVYGKHSGVKSTVPHEDIDFYKSTMLPWFVLWEQTLNWELFGENSEHFVEFLVEGLLRADSKTRNEVYQTRLRNGTMNRNEVRALENENPVPGGDEYTVTADLVPADLLADLARAKIARFEGGDSKPGPEKEDLGVAAQALEPALLRAFQRVTLKEARALERLARNQRSGDVGARLERIQADSDASLRRELGPLVESAARLSGGRVEALLATNQVATWWTSNGHVVSVTGDSQAQATAASWARQLTDYTLNILQGSE